ncbi:C-type lectin 2 [Plakobranchus ocellatus]|uniref:C-type lectin 2 n=1 Tax=Plakobranchus ocellatus TaxID=259542 RepID=A0AAV3ZQL9_9GAST|nr:C-type lectin 2 [Plakobranchus ocellatus]
MALLSILLLLAVLVIGTRQGDVANKFTAVSGGSRYMISENAEAFDLAKKNERCKSSGGYLVQIYLKRKLRDKGYRGRRLVYTGITDLGSEGRFYNYNDKKPARYLKWRRRQPDNWRGNEHCVNISLWGLNDIDCDETGHYICEIPA